MRREADIPTRTYRHVQSNRLGCMAFLIRAAVIMYRLRHDPFVTYEEIFEMALPGKRMTNLDIEVGLRKSVESAEESLANFRKRHALDNLQGGASASVRSASAPDAE